MLLGLWEPGAGLEVEAGAHRLLIAALSTNYHRLSAAIDKRCAPDPQECTGSIVLPAPRTGP